MIPPLTPGFHSCPFPVSKTNRNMRPVIDLSVLNQYLIVSHFKIETNISITGSIILGMWTDGYFHTPSSPKFCKFLRFVWGDSVDALKTVNFCLSTAPLVFTRNFQAVVAHLHRESIFIHFYLDDSLLKHVPQFRLRGYIHFL